MLEKLKIGEKMNNSFICKHKKAFSALVMFMVVGCVSLFAESDVASSVGDKVGILLGILGSPWVKGVACVALIIEAIAMLTAGRQEPGMFKKFVPWIVGTIIFMCAGTIASKFITSDENTFRTDTGISLITENSEIKSA